MAPASIDVEIRPAAPADAPDIVRAIQEADPGLALLTIYGSAGAADFVRDQIESPGPSRHHCTVAVADAKVVGCVVSRCVGDVVFLSYISVLAATRGRGIGARMVRAVAAAARQAGHTTFKVDVGEDNAAARAWYERLGFVYEAVADWWDVPLWGAKDGGATALPADYAGAEAQHLRWGFSQFTLETSRGRYVVGRLNTHWFRITDAAALADPCVGPALARLDAARHVLAILPEGGLPAPARAAARLLRRSLRMFNTRL